MNRIEWISALLVLQLSACSAPNDEQQIRDAISQLTVAVEQRNQRDVMPWLATDFRAHRDLYRQDMNQLMYVQFRQNKHITVFLSDMSVRVSAPKADVEMTALLLGSSQWLPERGQRYRVRMRWSKQGDDWLIERLDWQTMPQAE